MRKIDISNYTVKGRNQEGQIIDAPYDVRASIMSILFHPDLRLEAVEALERDKLANKINDCKDGFVLLEDADYKKVEEAIKAVKGFTRNDVEFVRRVLEAETVPVKEDK